MSEWMATCLHMTVEGGWVGRKGCMSGVTCIRWSLFVCATFFSSSDRKISSRNSLVNKSLLVYKRLVSAFTIVVDASDFGHEPIRREREGERWEALHRFEKEENLACNNERNQLNKDSEDTALMTKGGSAKSKTLGKRTTRTKHFKSAFFKGRLIFGEKRKQHASPARHRSSTRNRGSLADLSAPPVVTTPPPVTSRARINLHDWAVWRMQLNEQMAAVKGESRADLRSMRQYLQSNAFYQQHSRDPSTGRYTGVRLLFSIPRAKFKPEYLDGLQGRTAKAISHELGEAVNYEQNYLQTHSDDRTTTSVNSISALQPLIMDKAISQFLPKGLATNFLQINEPFAALDAMRTR